MKIDGCCRTRKQSSIRTFAPSLGFAVPFASVSGVSPISQKSKLKYTHEPNKMCEQTHDLKMPGTQQRRWHSIKIQNPHMQRSADSFRRRHHQQCRTQTRTLRVCVPLSHILKQPAFFRVENGLMWPREGRDSLVVVIRDDRLGRIKTVDQQRKQLILRGDADALCVCVCVVVVRMSNLVIAELSGISARQNTHSKCCRLHTAPWERGGMARARNTST